MSQRACLEKRDFITSKFESVSFHTYSNKNAGCHSLYFKHYGETSTHLILTTTLKPRFHYGCLANEEIEVRKSQAQDHETRKEGEENNLRSVKHYHWGFSSLPTKPLPWRSSCSFLYRSKQFAAYQSILRKTYFLCLYYFIVCLEKIYHHPHSSFSQPCSFSLTLSMLFTCLATPLFHCLTCWCWSMKLFSLWYFWLKWTCLWEHCHLIKNYEYIWKKDCGANEVRLPAAGGESEKRKGQWADLVGFFSINCVWSKQALPGSKQSHEE